jgi:hypothetical protein
MKKTLAGLCFLLMLTLRLGAATAAPTLQVTGGVLSGAQGVEVNGSFFDVAFRDGTCVAIFSGCDSPSDFAFVTSALANAASRALLDQVFLDGALGQFDSRPSLIAGCADNTGQGFCAVFTPVDFGVNNSVAQNSSLESSDQVRGAFTLPGENLLIYDTVVYAVWTPHAPAVSEPPTLLLVLGGGAFMLLARRRLAVEDLR